MWNDSQPQYMPLERLQWFRCQTKTFIESYFTESHKFPTMFKFPKLLIIWPQILQTDKTTSEVFENAEKNYKKNLFLLSKTNSVI